MLQTLGENLEEFTEKLDALHSYVAKGWEMNAPLFHEEKSTDGTMLYYYSDRGGLFPIMPGRTDRIIEILVAREFFNGEVTMVILNQGEEKKHTGKKEHVIFLVQAQASSSLYLHLVKRTEKKSHSNLLLNFDPVYPERLWVEERTFCCAFLFLLVFDKAIQQACVNIQRFISGIRNPEICLDKYFAIIHPQDTFTIFSIRINKHQVSLFSKQKEKNSSKLWRNQSMLKLRGENVCVGNFVGPCMICLCSPKHHSLEEAEELKMYLSDIAPHDMMRVLILLNHQHLKEELRIFYKNLETEKKMTENLLYTMLTKHIASQCKEGKKVDASNGNMCCFVLFSIWNLLAQQSPIQHLLSKCFSKFLDVCQLQTIADANMVVREVPVPITSCPARVANLVLGMGAASQEGTNPITEEPIQIGVGVHSGSVLPGAVGEPRYCLCGDTVNTAAQRESHSLPNSIHLSSAASVQNQGSKIDARGETKVKGKGKMTTYFLRNNLHANRNHGEKERPGMPQIKQYCSEFQEMVASSFYFKVSGNSAIIHLKPEEKPSRNSIYIIVARQTFFFPSPSAVSEHFGWS
uniref:guanylate cyclase n=1 Tax=Dromaius novaehollandiae TaxID=8790 RepID=A0A8C4PAX4_DRONO